MKYVHKIIFITLCVVVSASCKKGFLDVNSNPNIPTDDNITPELIFPQAADLAGGQIIIPQSAFISRWMGYFAPNGDYARVQQETSYNIDFTFSNGIWASYYNALFDLYLTKEKAQANGNNVLAAASMILSAKLFQEVVDMFGNVPYSQAFKEKQFPLPEYDDATSIYTALQQSLDSAIIYMKETAPISFASVDVVNNGDQPKWIKFANTLKLRLLIRQSEVAGFNPAAEIAKIDAEGGILEAGETIGVNPGYNNQLLKQSPFYTNYGYTPTYVRATASLNANAYIIAQFEAFGDARIGRFFQDVGGNYNGCEYGLDPGELFSGTQASYFGPGLIGDLDLGGKFTTGASQTQWMMPSFESLFFKAEAIARGWIAGDAQTALNEAITESFVWLGVPDAEAEAAAYIASATDVTDLANAGGSALEKAQFIGYQKYLALCGIDALEAWSDLRRINMLGEDDGYISYNPSIVSETLPLRLLYPQTEYTANGENALAEGTIDAFTSKLFWQP